MLESEYRKAEEYTKQVKIKKKAAESSEKKRNPRDFVKKVRDAADLERQALEVFEKAVTNEKKVHTAKRRIGEVYHPVTLKTGKLQGSNTVEKLLKSCFTVIYKGASTLSKRCIDRIDKAKRVLPEMIATIEFFFMMTGKIIARANDTASEKKYL